MTDLLDKIDTSKLSAKERKELQRRFADSKSQCPAATRINSLPNVNMYLEKDVDVYSITITEKGKERNAFFKQCSRNNKDGCRYCFEHQKKYDLDPEEIQEFDDIMKNDDATKITEKFEVKKRSAKDSADNNPEPIFVIKATKSVKKMFADAMKKFEDSPADEEKDASSDGSTSEDDSETEKAAESDDGLECATVATKDGRELSLDKDNNMIYDVDDDGNGTELGEMKMVDDDSAPIEYEGQQYIVAQPIEDSKKKGKMVRCALSNKLYREKGSGLVKVGRVSQAKSGAYKFIYDK
jgi:hypothetical protein